MAELKFDRGLGIALDVKSSTYVPNDEVWRVSFVGKRVELADGKGENVGHQVTLGGGTKIYNALSGTGDKTKLAVVGVAFKVVS